MSRKDGGGELVSWQRRLVQEFGNNPLNCDVSDHGEENQRISRRASPDIQN
jgi:hypothetical protein